MTTTTFSDVPRGVSRPLTRSHHLTAVMAPAERADVIVDFADVAVGNYVLRNIGPDEPFGGGVPEKDTVIADPGQVTRVRARFNTPGQFVWHCHIVEHEDNEVMRPYRIGPEQPGQPSSRDWEFRPTAYLAEHKIPVATGDTVEILGSRVTIYERPVLLARIRCLCSTPALTAGRISIPESTCVHVSAG